MAHKPPRDTELEAILEKIRQARNFDFRNYKRATLQRRIERRMGITRCKTRAAYLTLLDRDPSEVTTLLSSMLIKLTTFQPAAPAASSGLLRKYQELLVKHEALVHKLGLRTSERISIHKLATWAVETHASALALLGDGILLLANQRWHQLSQGGPWCAASPAPAQPVYKSLRQVAQAASDTLRLRGDDQPLLERYQEQAGEGRTLEVRVERVATPAGAPPQRAVLVLVQDITAQVQAERQLEEARAALAHQEHLRALGEMAAGLAHDLNSTLSSMRLRLELIERDVQFAERHRANIDALGRIVSDASTRVRRLQDFSRQQPEPQDECVQLADVIHGAAEMVCGELEGHFARGGLPMRLQIELPTLPLVHGHATDLRYVFINLLLNARDAMPHGGSILVSGSSSGSKVLIIMEDEGSGIPPEHLHAIFQPFFTTKGSQGTGLGLSMAYGTMARMGGSISAANRPQGGAVFTLTFPTAVPQQPAQPPAPQGAKRPSRSPTRRPKA